MGGGDFNRQAIIKYDARAGRIHRIDRTNASGSWETSETEITNGFQAIFDLENIETGWLNFPAGGAPDMRLAKIGTPLPERPSDKHRAGFRVLMKLGKGISLNSQPDVREMAANAKVSIAAMDKLYDAYVAGVKDNPGKLPVVTLSGTEKVVSNGRDENGKPQSSTNYQPVWTITKWVDRPPELVIGAAPANEPKAEPVQQMKTTEQAQPAPAEDDDF
jgi:hypothetical protein